jgi:hypothetical protein
MSTIESNLVILVDENSLDRSINSSMNPVCLSVLIHDLISRRFVLRNIWLNCVDMNVNNSIMFNLSREEIIGMVIESSTISCIRVGKQLDANRVG